MFGKKDVHTLADDLIDVLTVNNPTPVPASESESDSEPQLPISSTGNLKRKSTYHKNGSVQKNAN